MILVYQFPAAAYQESLIVDFMKNINISQFLLILLLSALSGGYSFGQTVVRVDVDIRQNKAELVNMGARTAADNFMNDRFSNIENNKKTALENLTLVDVIQERVYNSLTTIDKTVRQSKSVLQASTIVSDIIKYQLEMVKYAKSDPVLLLFAQKSENDFKLRALDLILYIQKTVMIEKSGVLLDVGKRDQLLSYVIDELRVLRAFSYTASRQIYWAQMDGIFRSLNPWQNYINRDKETANDILRNFKY